MAKVRRFYFVKLDNVTENSTKKSYEDESICVHIGHSGLLVEFESERKRPGELFLTFYHEYNADSAYLQYRKTSYGIFLENTKERIVFKTTNSTYNFSVVENEMTEVEKKLLYLNVFC